MCVYLFMLYEIGYGNIFMINVPIALINVHYYISLMVVSILSVVCGLILEKRNL
ncbi:MAG: hypothetical protein LUH02_06670 [Erysipelotrichaceae bacterium]|nr:hypothetical protein [Erysipelotrichaceae bacterium]